MTMAALIEKMNDALRPRHSNFMVAAIAGEPKIAAADFDSLVGAVNGLRRRPHILVVDQGGYEYCLKNLRQYPSKTVRLVVAVGDPKAFPNLDVLVAQPCGKTQRLPDIAAFDLAKESFLEKVRAVSGLWGI